MDIQAGLIRLLFLAYSVNALLFIAFFFAPDGGNREKGILPFVLFAILSGPFIYFVFLAHWVRETIRNNKKQYVIRDILDNRFLVEQNEEYFWLSREDLAGLFSYKESVKIQTLLVSMDHNVEFFKK